MLGLDQSGTWNKCSRPTPALTKMLAGITSKLVQRSSDGTCSWTTEALSLTCTTLVLNRARLGRPQPCAHLAKQFDRYQALDIRLHVLNQQGDPSRATSPAAPDPVLLPSLIGHQVVPQRREVEIPGRVGAPWVRVPKDWCLRRPNLRHS